MKVWRRSFDVRPPALEAGDERDAHLQPAYRDVDPADVPARWFVRWTGAHGSDIVPDAVSDDGCCAAITEPMLRLDVEAKFAGLEIDNIFRVMD